MSSIHIARSGQSLGSFSEEEVREGISSKRFLKEDLVWRVGMSDWLPLYEVAHAWGFDVSLLDETVNIATTPPDFAEPAWERRQEVGFFKALYQTIFEVLFSPYITFSKMKKSGGLRSPLTFYLSMILLQAPLNVAYQLALISNNPSSLGPNLAALPHYVVIGSLFLGSLIMTILLCIPLLFLVTSFFHWSLRILQSTHEPFETTFRIGCYLVGANTILSLFSLVIFFIATHFGLSFFNANLCGLGFIAIWGSILYFIGLMQVHRLSFWRTVAVVSLAIVIYVIFSFLIGIVLFYRK